MDPESPQIVDLSEGEVSDSEQEGPDSGTPELDQLMLIAMDFDSFALASPSVTRVPLWKFAEETSSGSQTQPVTVQAQPVTSTPAQPSGSQTQTQASTQAQPQGPAQARPQAPAQAQAQASASASLFPTSLFN